MENIIKTPKTRIASFDVDAQYTFTPVCPSELPVPGGDEIAAELNAQAQFAAVRIGSKDAHSPKAIWVADTSHPQFSPVAGDNVDIHWAQHAVPGSKGFEFLASLPQPADYDFFVWKGIELDMHPYGACYHDLHDRLSTGVIEYLKIRQIDTVIVGGLATDYCVKTTVMQLRRAGFAVVVNLGACRGIAAETVNAAITEMKNAGVQFVETAAQLQNKIAA